MTATATRRPSGSVTAVYPSAGIGSPVVQTHGLTKSYGPRAVAVDGLCLTIRRGEVYGFLGPNGAGKTTALKMILGLIRPTSGTATIMGKEPGNPFGLDKIGALIESPCFYPYLSGRKNLRVMAGHAGVTRSRVDQVLGVVGLSGRAEDRFREYSLGMKQRLGVAAALLKDPELLILDEPTNGLDPRGIADMRTLIRKFGREERTVLLSTHLLGEVEQVCDRVGVINQGRLVADAEVSQLRGREGLLVKAEPLGAAAYIAQRLAGVEDSQMVDGMLWLTTKPERAAEINRKLINAGLEVSEVRPIEQSLEDAFLRLTAGGEK